MATKVDGGSSARKRRSNSESFSSNDCDRDVVSPASSYETEANFVCRMGERCHVWIAEVETSPQDSGKRHFQFQLFVEREVSGHFNEPASPHFVFNTLRRPVQLEQNGQNLGSSQLPDVNESESQKLHEIQL